MNYFALLMVTALVVVLVEAFISSKWIPFYFKIGLPLFKKQKSFHSSNVDIQNIVCCLNNQFKKSGKSRQSIIFQKLNNQDVAFREYPFYTPLMHGVLHINTRKKTIKVTGLSNWFPIAFLLFWYSSFFQGTNTFKDIIPLVGPILFFIIVYLFQASKFNQVYKLLNDIIDKNHLTSH